jgi:xanthine dehydrogenase YagR molybdenum-binding subunit
VNTFVGAAVDRVDGPLKVAGKATYAAEFESRDLVHAVMVTSTIACGTILSIVTGAVERSPGVLAVMTFKNAVKLPKDAESGVNAPAQRALSLLQIPFVYYQGQPIAVVIAQTLEQAQHAATLIQVNYEPAPASTDFAAGKSAAYAPKTANQAATATSRGDVDAGLNQADVHLQQIYSTPDENHNPMEPHATLAAWNGDALTVHDSTQGVAGARKTLAAKLGVDPAKVQVISPYVGGGFGSKGSAWSHVVLAAMAAKHVGRPVRLVVERTQMYGPVGNRPRTEQKITLAAKRDGTLTAITHDSLSTTSMLEDWVEPAAVLTRMLYRCDNVRTGHRLVKLNIGTPTFQRAPGESSGSFALESALDELSYALQLDPIQLRLQNYAETDGGENKPFSSKSLRECYRVGAEKFGWAERNPALRSTRDGNVFVGSGMATATYPANRQKAAARVRLNADGTALVQVGTQDLGTGTYTILAQIAADALGLPLSRVRVQLGDSTLPEAPVSGGSMTTASVTPAVLAAARATRKLLIQAAVGDASSPLHAANIEDVVAENGELSLRTNPAMRVPYTEVLARTEGKAIVAMDSAESGEEKKKFSMHSFGAIFAQVRVDADLGEVRVSRVVAAYGIGKLLNAKTGRSQLQGGIVWGIGMALLEESLRDAASGRIVNANLADYHVPVNADIPDIEVHVVDEQDDQIGPFGAKGIGEIGITGVAAAIANAVYHAVGVRVRDLPITLDKILRQPA